MEGDTLYLLDFDEVNIDGIAIPIGTDAQHGTTFH